MLKKYFSFIFLLIIISSIFISHDKEYITSIKNNTIVGEAKNTDVIASINIPKINLKKELYSIKSSMNNVNKGIEIIVPSNMPDIVNGNLILAAHSGNSRISYFKNINKLTINDSLIINYKNKKYFYRLVNTYRVKKNGSVEIKRNNYKTCVTLITCDKLDKTKQIVLIFELFNIKNLS